MVRIIIRVIKGLFQCYNDLYGFDWILQIFSKAKAFFFVHHVQEFIMEELPDQWTIVYDTISL